MNLKMYKRSKIVSMLLVTVFISIFSIPSIALCEDINLNMSLNDGKKIVVELEKSNNYSKQINILEKGNKQLVEQLSILQEQVSTLQSELKTKSEMIDLTTKQIEDQKRVYEDKLKTCEETKPSFLQKVGGILGGVGIGVLIGIFL